VPSTPIARALDVRRESQDMDAYTASCVDIISSPQARNGSI